MKKFGVLFFLLWAVFIPVLGVAQDTEVESAKKSNATAVYGVTADDYLPSSSTESARQYLRPRVQRVRSHPNFNLPDGFYFVGGPIVLLILLWILTTFLNDFEEKRKQEQRQAASESVNPK